ncbi:MAG TPA: NAD(P)H-hydrate epimerase, partial [Polyangiaceae bacterium]|nr:NAD(P)H-hydrate epimerase [Polyangiaceae bacterium]
MKPVLSRAEVRELDRRAESEAEIPTLALMERAGRGATAIIVEHFPTPRRAIIVCGAGNNGGDGFVVARLLCEHGWSPSVFLVGDPAKLRGDALHNSRLWAEAGASTTTVDESSLPELERALGDAELVVDALFGTGLDRALTGLPASVVERLNAARAYRIALDLPSGLHANTGCPLGVAVRAHETVTFSHLKLGLLTSMGAEHAGVVTCVDIGIPQEASAGVGMSAEL